MRDLPVAGEHYRHFKGNEYVIMNIAKDTETGEQTVVYQDANNAASIYVRPLEMFMSEVERDKYPEVAQKYRFEKIEAEEPKVDQRLLDFLDASDYNKKIEILDKMRDDITEKLVEDMAVCLDFELNEGSLEDKFESIRKCLLTLQSFEGSRLRP